MVIPPIFFFTSNHKTNPFHCVILIGTALTVVWENVLQHDEGLTPLPLFTFGVTLYNTGDIAFAYKSIPIVIESIDDKIRLLKIGLSTRKTVNGTLIPSLETVF